MELISVVRLSPFFPIFSKAQRPALKGSPARGFSGRVSTDNVPPNGLFGMTRDV